MFEEGNKLSNGRPKGSPNKVTKDIREAYKEFVETNVSSFQDWIERVAKDNPAKALELTASLSEYFLPKLSRSEVKQEIEVVDNVDLAEFTTEQLKQSIESTKKQSNS